MEGLNGYSVFLKPFFDNPNDWGSLLEKGVHPVILGVIFTLLILISFVLNWLVWPLLNISPKDSFWRVMLIHLTYIVYTLLILIVSSSFYISTIPEYVIIVSIGTVFQLLFLIVRILTYNKVLTFLDRISHTKLKEHKWSAVISSFIIACILISIELSIFKMS